MEEGYNKEEAISFDETFALVSKMEATSILIAFPAFMDFKLYHIYVKSWFFERVHEGGGLCE